MPFELNAHVVESEGSKLAHGVLLARGDDEVVRLTVLQNEPHTLYIVLGVAPVAAAGEVAEVELVLLALFDAGSSERDLPCHESLTAHLTLMVEEDTVAGEHVVGIAVLTHDPITILFGHSVGRVGVEWCILVLGYFLHLSKQFRRRSLVDMACISQSCLTHSF